MKPLRVAIDTSIFENVHYSFDGHDLGILKKHVADGKIKELLISDIVIQEAKKHFKEKAKALAERFTKLMNSREYKFFECTSSMKKSGLKPIDAEKISNEQFALFNKYLRETNSKKLSSDNVKVIPLLNDYFDNNPPFGNADKKHEFPDAIIIARLKEEVKKNGEIAVVSSDGDWKLALGNYAGVKFFESLGQLFGYITQQEELDKALAKKALLYYLHNQAEIESRIEGILRDKSYDLDGMSWDRHGVCEGFDYDSAELKNLSVDTRVNNIDYIGEDEIIFTLKVSADFEFECSYFDESNSPWDSEEDCYWWETYGTNYESHNLSLFTSVTFKLENGEITECTKIVPRIDGGLSFDHNTLVDRVPVETDGFWQYRQSYTCPKCGHEFSINLLESAESTIIDERGMGAETAHEVSYDDECAHCGKKFTISGSVYEYPEGAFNYDDTKIEWEK